MNCKIDESICNSHCDGFEWACASCRKTHEKREEIEHEDKPYYISRDEELDEKIERYFSYDPDNGLNFSLLKRKQKNSRWQLLNCITWMPMMAGRKKLSRFIMVGLLAIRSSPKSPLYNSYQKAT